MGEFYGTMVAVWNFSGLMYATGIWDVFFFVANIRIFQIAVLFHCSSNTVLLRYLCLPEVLALSLFQPCEPSDKSVTNYAK